MKYFILIFTVFMSFHASSQELCTPTLANTGDVRNAIALVDHEGYKFSGALVNNSNEDGEYYFVTSAYPFKNPCNGGNSTTDFMSSITFKWSDGTTTTGATLETSVGGFQETVLLKLSTTPPFTTIPYLGALFTSGTPDRALQYFGSNALCDYNQITSYSSSQVETICDQFNGDEFNIGSGTDAYEVVYVDWDFKSSDEYTKGGVLLDEYERILGIYVTKNGSDNCSEITTYYAELDEEIYTELGSEEDIRGIKITPCVDELTLSNPITVDKDYTASIRITGESVLGSSVIVSYIAGEEVVLDDGFQSSNEFIAEIAPCSDIVVSLAKNKGAPMKESNSTLLEVQTNNKELNVYPTIIFNNQVTIEIEGIEKVEYFITDLLGRLYVQNSITTDGYLYKSPILLPNLPSGIYLMQLKNGSEIKTIKLIKK